MVLHHVRLVVSSLPEAKKFYLAALAPLGFKEHRAVEGVVGLSGPDGVPNLWLASAKGPDNPPTKGAHIAFAAENREVVAKFHEAALKAGAKDNGAPGPRGYTPTYYAAFVHDLDGNNIEVVHI